MMESWLPGRNLKEENPRNLFSGCMKEKKIWAEGRKDGERERGRERREKGRERGRERERKEEGRERERLTPSVEILMSTNASSAVISRLVALCSSSTSL